MRQRSESLGIEEQEMVERVRAAVPWVGGGAPGHCEDGRLAGQSGGRLDDREVVRVSGGWRAFRRHRRNGSGR
ncbi:MAG: hypothetical protein Ct9H300mP1_35390 [Planctomycetaceae bacterium]|nr:MAG: hypothetical protein Ct9H300mP1_35390 [Planctomycetaceae bacterium]